MSMPDTSDYSGKSETVFFDDFTAGQLDRTKWNVRVTGGIVNNEQQAYVDSDETIYIAAGQEATGSNGYALALHPRYRPGFITPEGNKMDFISGRLDTRDKFEFTYGIASARMKLSVGTGLWPAFWAMGTGKWPDAGEIDIMENIGEPDWTSAAVHGRGYSGEEGLVNYGYFPAGTDVTGWHIYSVDWTPNYMKFFVDGVLIYRVTRSMVEFFGDWVFDNSKFN